MVFYVIFFLGMFILNIQNTHAVPEIKIKNANDTTIKDNQLTNDKDNQLTNGSSTRRFKGPEVVMRAENGDEPGIMGIDKIHVTVLCESCTEEQMIMKDFMNSMIAAAVTFTDGLTHSRSRPIEIHQRSDTSTTYEIKVSKALQTVTTLFSNQLVRKFVDNLSQKAAQVFRAYQQ